VYPFIRKKVLRISSGFKMKGGTPMGSVRLLSQGKILQEWWQEVKENFWEDDVKPNVTRLIKELMEMTMEEEMELYQEEYEEVNRKKVYRNGYYQRDLVTQFGLIEDIGVPRLRGKGFKTKVFKRYKRYEDVVEDLVGGMFLAGVSTRRVGEAVAKLLDTKVSSAKVST
jgi:transposase-like protein